MNMMTAYIALIKTPVHDVRSGSAIGSVYNDAEMPHGEIKDAHDLVQGALRVVLLHSVPLLPANASQLTRGAPLIHHHALRALW